MPHSINPAKPDLSVTVGCDLDHPGKLQSSITFALLFGSRLMARANISRAPTGPMCRQVLVPVVAADRIVSPSKQSNSKRLRFSGAV
jgi:hypothetical protein